jgi:hypothetical protein
MYAQVIVDRRLDIAEEELKYRPVRHSIEEVDQFCRHLEKSTKLDDSARPYFTRDLERWEYNFIENERIMCQCDAEYWLTRYAWISDENNNAVRFKFRGAQPALFGVISELESIQAAIELLIGKGRQQYVTTLTQLLASHRVFFHHYTYGVVASADAAKSAEMAEKAFFTYDHMPWWLKPKYSRRVEGVPGILKFDSMESRLSILHGATSARAKGAQKTGIARGSTPTVYAISEVAHFPNAEQTIEAALFGGVHANPKILGCLESTFAGDKNWFANRYKASKALMKAGRPVRLRPLFFSWPCAREIYPTPTWWRTNAPYMPSGWIPSGKVAEQILKAEMFIRTDPLLSIYFGVDYRMPIEQQWFYDVRYTESERNGTLNTLMQEMPCDDVEAMVSSFDNVFGKDVIEVISESRERQFEVYGFTGQAISERFEPHPDEIDYDKPRKVFNHHVKRNNEVYRWELIPLRYDLYEEATGEDAERGPIDARLFVYKPYDPDFDYSIGIDTANGLGADATVINVNRIGKPGTPDVQVAEFRSHLISHVEAFAFAMPIALMYRNPVKEVLGWPKMGIEQIASVGDVCQSELKKLGYPAGRFFRFGRYDTIEVKSKTNKQGWFTTGWSRPILTGHFVYAVKNGWYIVNSPWTIEECRQFEIHLTESGKERQEHSSESWDDGIFASAISYFIVHDMDSLAERSQRQFPGNLPEFNLPPVMIEPPQHGMMVSTTGYRQIMKLDDLVFGRVK